MPPSAEPTVTLTVSELASVIARAVAAAVPQTPAVKTVPPAAAPSPEPPAELLTTREAAELLGLSVKGLERLRATGRGPKHIRVGTRVRYRRCDLLGGD